MASPRYRKLAGDLRAMPGRLIAMVLALSLSLTGVGAALGARTVLRRTIATSYLSSRPADATIELAGDADAALVAAVRARPDIADAEARDAVIARFAAAPRGPAGDPAMRGNGAPGGAQLVQLFVIDDFAALRLNTFRRASGAWPPPTGTMLVERSALALLGAGEGEPVTIKTPHGAPRPVAIS